MICPECKGRGESTYYVETDRDENTVTVEARKGICRTCNGSGKMPMTNADRIRAMSDEELAVFLECFGCCHYCSEHERLSDNRWYSDERCDEKCAEHCLEWLEQPVEEENGK